MSITTELRATDAYGECTPEAALDMPDVWAKGERPPPTCIEATTDREVWEWAKGAPLTREEETIMAYQTCRAMPELGCGWEAPNEPLAPIPLPPAGLLMVTPLLAAVVAVWLFRAFNPRKMQG